jgi:hypothetical protein
MDDDLVLLGATDPLHARSPEPWPSRDEAQAVQVAPEADAGTVAKPAARGELGTIPGLGRKMSAQPRLALGEERVHVTLGVRPTAPTSRGHCHDHAALGMDDHAQATRPR